MQKDKAEAIIEREVYFDKWVRFDNICPNCKTLLQEKSNYCPNCGQKLDFNNPVREIIKERTSNA